MYRRRFPEQYGWDQQTHLLAAVVDALSIGNWQRAGDKHAKKPEPIQRPGASAKPSRTYGTTAMTFAEADQWLAGEGMSYETTENDLII